MEHDILADTRSHICECFDGVDRAALQTRVPVMADRLCMLCWLLVQVVLLVFIRSAVSRLSRQRNEWSSDPSVFKLTDGYVVQVCTLCGCEAVGRGRGR